MKNTLLKVMGIVMTLAILAGLLMASVPVSAAAMAWSANTVPAIATPTAPNILLAADATTKVFAVAPNGTTMLAYDNGTMYKSIDAGVTFAQPAVAPPAGLTMIKFASDSLSAVATDGTIVYYSADGGSTWGDTGAGMAAGTVYSLDVAPGPNILVGGEGLFKLFKAAGLFGSPWVTYNTVNTTIALALPRVIGIAFTPDYATSNVVVLIANDGTNTYARYQWAARPIGDQYADRILAGDTVRSAATIAFPSDFSAFTNANYLVGFSAGLYKVAIGGYTGTVIAANPANQVGLAPTSLSFMGTWAAGTAYYVNANAVNRVAAVAALSSASYATSTVPSSGVTGSNVVVAASQTAAGTVYVLSSGVGGALQVSTDGGASFDATQLIQVGAGFAFLKVTMVDAKNMFIIATDAGVNSIFKSADGITWKRIQYSTVAGYTGIYASPAFATDNTIYITSGNSTTYKSIDGGNNLIPFVAAGTVTAMAVVDANTYYYIAGGFIYKSGSYTALTATGVYYSLEYISPTLIYAGGTDGNVYKSIDGATFAAVLFAGVGPFVAGTNVTVAANAAGVLYAGDATFNLGVESFGATGWVTYGTTTVLPPTKVITDLALAADGTLYAVNVGGTPNVYRIADGLNWQSTGWTGIPDTTSRLNLLGSTLYVNNMTKLANFTETMSVAPAFTTPAANALVDSNNVVLAWTAIVGATSYNWSVTDSFGNVTDSGTSAITTVFITPALLRNGVQYYATLQVAAPFFSKVSAQTGFTTKLTNAGSNLTAVGGLAPAAGSSTTATSPTFNWAAVANATSYDIKISSKADFSDTIDSMTGLTTTVYTTNVKLTPGVYYWEIRAANAITKSDWVQTTFTVVPPPVVVSPTPITLTVPTPNVTVNVPTQPAQVQPTVIVNIPTSTPNTQTPAWAWIVIAIGAVLVIAVIVLIVRTRKV